jgi:hypothetical protein
MQRRVDVRKTMSITISLSPETEEKLRRRATETGLSPDALAGQLLEQALQGSEPVAPAGRPGEVLDEVLAPFRKEVAESGMTEEQLRDFFTAVRDEVRAESRAGQAQG